MQTKLADRDYNSGRTPQECVDRNLRPCAHWQAWGVALHRSAWIEIGAGSYSAPMAEGRTPQECVDRNFFVPNRILWENVALHRSAWIEMYG